MKQLSPFICTALLALFSHAHAESPAHHSKYAGQEKRSIKSLSKNDIEELKKGAGWGLAKAAELNGVPGPIHILEMEKEIHLTTEQKEKITDLYNRMKANAIPLGKKLIEQEKSLNDRFANSTINDASLRKQLQAIAITRAQLRYVHLSAHLQTPNILSKQQISQYNELRGYNNNTDPCQNIPKGHNEKMWKMHHGC